MAELTVNQNAIKSELLNEALTFTRYSGDFEAMEYLDSVLSELKWHLKEGEFKDFTNRINVLLEENLIK